MRKRVTVKPSKARASFGLFVGIIFCIIGVVIVIPTFGLFGLLWTAIAAGITVKNWKQYSHKPEDRDMYGYEVAVDDLETVSGGAGSHRKEAFEESETKEDIQGRLELIEQLYQEGTITREEYDLKRQQILSEI